MSKKVNLNCENKALRVDMGLSKEKKKVAIVYDTRFFHVESLAQEIAKGVDSCILGAAQLICIGKQAKDYSEILHNLQSFDAIIFGTPTHFGSVTPSLKQFMDSTSKVWLNQGWKDKIAAGFTHSSTLSGDKLNTLMQIKIFAAQHGMIWVGMDSLPENQLSDEDIKEYAMQDLQDSFNGEKVILNRLGSWLGLMAQTNPKGQNTVCLSDLASARYFGIRVMTIVNRFNK